MEQFKHYLASRTLWALVISFLANIAGRYGYSIGEADQAFIVDTALKAVEYGGYIAAAVYRIKASKVLGKAKA